MENSCPIVADHIASPSCAKSAGAVLIEVNRGGKSRAAPLTNLKAGLAKSLQGCCQLGGNS
jgi:hypothetical protein